MSDVAKHDDERSVGRAALPVAVMIVLVVANRVMLAHQFELAGAPPYESDELIRRDLIRAMLGVALFPALGLASWSRTIRRGGTTRRAADLGFLVGLVAMWFHLVWMYDWIRESYLGMPGWLVMGITAVSRNAAIWMVLAVGVAVARGLPRPTRLALGLVLGAAACSPEKGGGGPALSAERGAVLPLDVGRAAINPCTRWRPLGVTSFWTPSQAQVADLESRLGGELEEALVATARRWEPPKAVDYYRQYVGIRRWTGKRTIYVSGFHEEFFEASRDRFADKRRYPQGVDSLRWRMRPVSVCDGGQWFFGVEYDPRSQRFGHVRFNSRAG